MEPDPRIVLRDYPPGELNNVIVDHPEQPADYVHTDGTAWTWRSRWRLVGGVTTKEAGDAGPRACVYMTRSSLARRVPARAEVGWKPGPWSLGT
jgi:hypothetical protein